MYSAQITDCLLAQNYETENKLRAELKKLRDEKAAIRKKIDVITRNAETAFYIARAAVKNKKMASDFEEKTSKQANIETLMRAIEKLGIKVQEEARFFDDILKEICNSWYYMHSIVNFIDPAQLPDVINLAYEQLKIRDLENKILKEIDDTDKKHSEERKNISNIVNELVVDKMCKDFTGKSFNELKKIITSKSKNGKK